MSKYFSVLGNFLIQETAKEATRSTIELREQIPFKQRKRNNQVTLKRNVSGKLSSHTSNSPFLGQNLKH
jgi:hypothetical protein